MKQPSQRETTNRDEMICPRCDTEGLEENPAYMGEYQGRSSLLKATRCPNEECDYHYGVPKDEVKKQMPAGGGSILSNLTPEDINFLNVLKFVFVFVGLIVLSFQLGIIPLGSDTGDGDVVLSKIDGKITDSNNISDVNNLSVNLVNNEGENIQSVETNENGSFVFEDVEDGNYVIYASGSDLELNPPGKEVNVNSQNKTVDINLIESDTQVIDQIVNNATISLDYKNPNNINDINLQLSPIEGENVERTQTINSDTESTILTPITPREEQIRVNSTIKKDNNIINKVYNGEPQDFGVTGNMNPEDFKITLTNQTKSEVQSKTVEVPPSGTTEDILVSSNETVGDVTVTIKDGTAQERNQKTGTWEGQEEISFYTGVSSFTSANLLIEPIISERNTTITGEINSDSITHNFEGNRPIEDAVITFNGGQSSVSTIGSENINISAKNGTTDENVINIAEVDKSGNYRINIEPEIYQNPDLVNLYYEVNENRTEVTDSVSEPFALDNGDVVKLIYSAERETTVSNDETPPLSADGLNDNLVIKDIRVSPENPESGDNVELYITVKNTGSSEITDEFQVYYDKSEVTSTRTTISSGEEVEIGGINTFGTINMNEEGTSVWYINQQGPFFVDIGDSQPVFGNASVSASVQDLSSQGQVSIDTTQDGETDCTVLAEGGSCSFSSIEPTQKTFNIEEMDVEGTDYTINYTRKTAPRDITADIGNDNITDLDYEGILTENESINRRVEIRPENETVKFSSENNEKFEYAFSWNSDSVINNPVVDVGGETVIKDEGIFQQDKSFKIGKLTEGENEFRFSSSSGGYTAEIEWVEDEGQSYPSVLIGENEVCNTSDFANNLTCSVNVSESSINVGENTIQFTKTSQTTFNYQINYTGRASARYVDVEINNETERFSRPSATPRAWEDVRSTSVLERGENSVKLVSPEENGIVPDSKATIRYSIDTGSVENPKITVENANNETYTVNIPQDALDSNQLINETEVNVPSDWLTLGGNTITISTEKGVFEMYGEINGSDEILSFSNE